MAGRGDAHQEHVLHVMVTDLDGTAVANSTEALPTEKVTAAVAASPLEVIVATGRSWPGAHKPIAALGVTGLCVISGGTQVVDSRDGQMLWEARMDPASWQLVAGTCAQVVAELLCDDEQLGEGTVGPGGRDERYMTPRICYLMGAERHQAEQVRHVLGARRELHVATVDSWRDKAVDVHITPAWGTKRHGINIALERCGWSKADAVGVGDSGLTWRCSMRSACESRWATRHQR
jgi:hydroxymethylpyrimidine pyrophosphatase-like HAD family hydrolase